MKPLLVGFLAIIGLSVAFGAGVATAPFVSVATRAVEPSPVPTLAPTVVAVQAASQTELKAAADRAKFLTTRYGMAEAEVTALTKASYDVAAMIGLKPDGRTALHEITLDFAENGGTGLRRFGVEGDNESVARALGFQSGAALRALVPRDVVRARALMATVGLLKYLMGT